MTDAQIYSTYCKAHKELCKLDCIPNDITATHLLLSMLYTQLHLIPFSAFAEQDQASIQTISSIIETDSEILLGTYSKVPKSVIETLHGSFMKWGLTLDNYKEIFGSLFEKYITKKESGAYYTMPTTTRYISELSICSFLLSDIIKGNPIYKLADNGNPIAVLKLIYNSLSDSEKAILMQRLNAISILDPTCGTGAFVIQGFLTLLSIYSALDIDISKDLIEHISFNNLFGVDIDDEAIAILKFRMLVLLDSYGISASQFKNFRIGNTVHSASFDWRKEFKNEGKFDVVIGNPPYVEISKSSSLLLDDFETLKCGNLYAIITERVIKDLLVEGGVMGFIIPISIASTPRMSKLRKLVYDNSGECFYSHFADRPGCLFSGVHQKLTICILSKSVIHEPKLYTTRYFHWEKDAETELFSQVKPYRFYPTNSEAPIPKICSPLEEHILQKVVFSKSLNVLTETVPQEGNDVWLNMRMCFWCKAFSHSKGSKEYKRFSFETPIDAKVFAAFLNSSLFFFLWEAMSDCWHITSKELDLINFSIKGLNHDLKEEIANNFDSFEAALESSKKFIGSVQTDYIYQHKLHKDLIDRIDESIAKIFSLSSAELHFLRNYQSQYRLNTVHQKPLTVVDVFSGAGGLSLGFERAGFDVVLANEIDSQIALTYRCNHLNTLMLNCDIREFVEDTDSCIDKFAFTNQNINVDSLREKLEHVDVVIGGPPCQGFSMAGGRIRKSKALFEDPRNFLFKYYFKIIQKYEPKFFVFENVVGLLSSKNGEIIDTIKELFQDPDNFKNGGYTLHLKVFNASDFGVPQARKRVLIIGSKFDFDLNETIANTLATLPDSKRRIFEHKATVRDAIADLADSVDTGKIPNHRSTTHSPKAMERIKKIKPNENFRSLDEDIKSVHSGSYGRLDWDGVATTITTRFDTPSGGRYIHPVQDRTITPREAARLQTFPDDFIFHGSKSSICTQIGNAVPPRLAEFVAHMINYLNRN